VASRSISYAPPFRSTRCVSCQELDDKFEMLYAPQSAERKNYVEFANQKEPVRTFWEEKAAFKDAALRDEFNRGLAKLGESREYAKLLERYSVELPRTVCD
jgi:predicted RNA-binding protein YlxR (DUF448 family)